MYRPNSGQNQSPSLQSIHLRVVVIERAKKGKVTFIACRTFSFSSVLFRCEMKLSTSTESNMNQSQIGTLLQIQMNWYLICIILTAFMKDSILSVGKSNFILLPIFLKKTNFLSACTQHNYTVKRVFNIKLCSLFFILQNAPIVQCQNHALFF